MEHLPHPPFILHAMPTVQEVASFRVTTANWRFGSLVKDGKIEEAKAFLKILETHTDIVIAQECYTGLKELMKEAGYVLVVSSESSKDTYTTIRTMVYNNPQPDVNLDGFLGNMIFIKASALKTGKMEVVDIGVQRINCAVRLDDTLVLAPRSAVWMAVDVLGKRYLIMTLHLHGGCFEDKYLDVLLKSRAESMANVLRLAEKLAGEYGATSVLVGGDINSDNKTVDEKYARYLYELTDAGRTEKSKGDVAQDKANFEKFLGMFKEYQHGPLTHAESLPHWHVQKPKEPTCDHGSIVDIFFSQGLPSLDIELHLTGKQGIKITDHNFASVLIHVVRASPKPFQDFLPEAIGNLKVSTLAATKTYTNAMPYSGNTYPSKNCSSRIVVECDLQEMDEEAPALQEFMAALLHNVRGTNEEPGCSMNAYIVQMGGKKLIILTEAFDDEECKKAHRDAPHLCIFRFFRSLACDQHMQGSVLDCTGFEFIPGGGRSRLQDFPAGMEDN